MREIDEVAAYIQQLKKKESSMSFNEVIAKILYHLIVIALTATILLYLWNIWIVPIAPTVLASIDWIQAVALQLVCNVLFKPNSGFQK